MQEEEAAFYELPFEYIRKHVKPLRATNNRQRTRQKWWIHAEARPGLRKAIKGLERCIVTPEVSKHRIFVWMDTSIIPDHKVHVIARDDSPCQWVTRELNADAILWKACWAGAATCRTILVRENTIPHVLHGGYIRGDGEHI
jgi:hypothetical protein